MQWSKKGEKIMTQSLQTESKLQILAYTWTSLIFKVMQIGFIVIIKAKYSY
jgi:hypothetical protein